MSNNTVLVISFVVVSFASFIIGLLMGKRIVEDANDFESVLNECTKRVSDLDSKYRDLWVNCRKLNDQVCNLVDSANCVDEELDNIHETLASHGQKVISMNNELHSYLDSMSETLLKLMEPESQSEKEEE